MENGQIKKKFCEFGEFRLNTGDGKLFRGSEQIPLTHKAVDLLTLLVERRGEILTKSEILDALWRDTYVDENNLAVTVGMLRKAFGERANENRFIETVPRRGYRFVADVRYKPESGFVIEKQTQTRITIEETERDAVDSAVETRILERRVRRQSVLLAAVIGLIIVLGSVFGYLYRTSRSENEAQAILPNASPAPRTIAVLPFRNLNQKNADEFVNVGLTDALITKLGNVRGLIVRPTSAILPFAEQSATTQEIAAKLNVETVLEGTVQTEGGRLRFSVQLVRAADGAVLWSNRFEENSGEVFKIQDSLSAQLADALLFDLTKEERMRLAAPDTDNAEAYRLYLKGRFLWNKRTPKHLLEAAEAFEQSVALDPRYAQAYAGLGASYILLGDSGFSTIHPAEMKEKARRAVQSALAVNPNIAEAYAVLGNLQIYYDWNKQAAEESLRRAIEINPNYATAHHWLGWCLIVQQRFAEAETEFKRAAELDPTSMAIITEQGYPAFFAGDLTRAETLFRQAVAVDGNYASARMCLWRVLHRAGRSYETTPQVEAVEAMGGTDFPVVLMARARSLAATDRPAAEAIYQKLIARKQSGEYISPLYLAMITADLNDANETFRWLDECFKERNDYLLFLPFAPEFKRFETDARLQQLRNKVGV